MFGAFGLNIHTLLCPDLYELRDSELGSSALDGKRAISLVHIPMLMFACTFECLNGLSRERLERNGVGESVRNVGEPGRAATKKIPWQGGIFREARNGFSLLESPTL